MSDETIWQTISNAGIHIRPDFSDPSQWVSATRWRQYGPFKTREEALGAAVRGLVEQVGAATQTIERAEEQKWWERIFGLFS